MQELGAKVLHIKTDSIKILNPTKEIEKFILKYGKDYGYTFEVESVYERFCLVNNAVYIAKEKDGKWTATGKQFQVPFVFKTLFSHEPLIFEDFCETKEVKKGDMYLNMRKDDKDNYVFIGRVGRFTPVKDGGILCRKIGDKYHAVTGTKRTNGDPYLWLESEAVKDKWEKIEEIVDKTYYERLVNEAVKTISNYGDFEQLIANDILEGNMNPPEKPPWEE